MANLFSAISNGSSGHDPATLICFASTLTSISSFLSFLPLPHFLQLWLKVFPAATQPCIPSTSISLGKSSTSHLKNSSPNGLKSHIARHSEELRYIYNENWFFKLPKKKSIKYKRILSLSTSQNRELHLICVIPLLEHTEEDEASLYSNRKNKRLDC